MNTIFNNGVEKYQQLCLPDRLLKEEARGTDIMPKPLDAAKIVSFAISKVVEYETGSFLDVREL